MRPIDLEKLQRECVWIVKDLNSLIEDLPEGHSFRVFLDEARRKVRLVDNMIYFAQDEKERRAGQ